MNVPGQVPAAPVNADGGAGLSFADILQMLGRHKLFILVCVLLGTGITLAYVTTATPIYEASASMRIDPSRASSLGLTDLLSGGGFEDSTAISSTEIAILRSDAVVIATLNSLSDEDFRQFAGKPKFKISLSPDATSMPADQEALLDKVKAGLSGKSVENTQLVMVTFRGPNPRVDATIVNHAMQAYLRQNFDSRTGSVLQVTDWLTQQLDDLRQRSADAQQKLANFQEKNEILGVDPGNNTTTDRLRLLNTRLAEAQSDRIVKEAQLRAVQTGDLSVLSSLITNPELSSLQAQQGALYSQYSQLSQKFGTGYTPLADMKKQMQAVDAEVQREVEAVRHRIQQEYNVASSTENMLQQQYNEQTEKAYALNRQQAQYAVLQAEGTSSRDLYDTLQYKLKQAGVDAGLNGVNTMVIDTARAPRLPIEPKKMAIVSFGVVLGLFAGVAVAFFKEALADTVQNSEQLERLLGYPLLAAIPRFKAKMKAGGEDNIVPGTAAGLRAMLVTYDAPLSRDAEAYRSLRNSLLLSSLNRPLKSVLVSSGLAAEGKSTTASNYAVVLAQHGSRVLLIDADLRRPKLHTQFGVSNQEGLTNLFLEQSGISPFLQPLPLLPGLTLLPAGPSVSMPSEALASQKFRDMIASWETEYDVVLIDSAPLLVVSDTLPLASYVDGLILVTRFNQTPIRFLRRLRDMLNRSNAHVVGTVINEISDAGANYGGYGYGDREYYS